MSNPGTPTNVSLSLSNGEVTSKGGVTTVSPGGEASTDGRLQQADAVVLTPEEKAAAEAALKDGTGLSSTKDETDKGETPPVLTPEEQSAKDLEDAKAAVKDGNVPENLKGLPPEELAKFAPFNREFHTTGDLKPESITAAAKAFNVSEAFVKEWVAGIKAQKAMAEASQAAANTPPKLSAEDQAAHDARVNTAVDALGGRPQWDAFADWANKNLPAEELQDLSTAVNLGGAIAKRTIAEYAAKYSATGSNPNGPRDLSKGTGSAPPTPEAPAGFASKADQHAALRDPRYGRDPKYRAEVDAKIVASKF